MQATNFDDQRLQKVPALAVGIRSAKMRVSRSRRASYVWVLGLWCPLARAAGIGNTGASFVAELCFYF